MLLDKPAHVPASWYTVLVFSEYKVCNDLLQAHLIALGNWELASMLMKVSSTKSIENIPPLLKTFLVLNVVVMGIAYLCLPFLK